MSGRLLFSTDALRERDRFPAFCEEIVRRYTGLDVATEDQAGFHATIEMQRAGSVDIGRIFTAPMNSIRTEDLVRDGDDSILVALLTRGEAYQTQSESDRRLAAGDAVICDCSYPGELNFTAESEFWDLKIPRSMISALMPGVGRFGGARLDKDPVARRLLFGYLAGSFALDLGVDCPAHRSYEQHLVSLVALAMGADNGARVLAERQGVAAVRRAAILREIETFMSDPALSAATIAARMGISPRYLRMLLEETGRSFSEHLLERRLVHAAALLRDPVERYRKIADIALACGFGDLSYFNRSFRRRHGATPSDIREQAKRDLS